MSFQERFRCLYDTVDIVRETFLKKLRYSFVIYDLLGNVVTTSERFQSIVMIFVKKQLKRKCLLHEEERFFHFWIWKEF